MSSIPNLPSIASFGSTMLRFAAEPVSQVSSVAGSALRGASAALSASSTSSTSSDPELQSLLDQQEAIEKQMEVFSMQSNIAQTRHDMDMTAIRNMKES
jgi:hypothetical protein